MFIEIPANDIKWNGDLEDWDIVTFDPENNCIPKSVFVNTDNILAFQCERAEEENCNFWVLRFIFTTDNTEDMVVYFKTEADCRRFINDKILKVNKTMRTE